MMFTREKRSLSSDEPDDFARSLALNPATLPRRLCSLCCLVVATAALLAARVSGRLALAPVVARPGGSRGPETLACALPAGRPGLAFRTKPFARRVAGDLVVSLTTVPERRRSLPVMLGSLARAPTLPAAVFVVASDVGRRCPPPLVAARRPSSDAATLAVHFVRAAADRGPIEKYVGALAAILAFGAPEFLLVLDDDHEYDSRVVGAYAAALRRRPAFAFTVQSPPSQLRFNASFPVAFGSRGVGFRRATADGLAAFHARAVAAEPLCRVVDDIVVSGFFAAKHVPVADVPGFSFKHRPWRQNKYVHETSKVKRLRSANRTLDNARCHDAIAATLRRRR